jgi:hypothetical protein
MSHSSDGGSNFGPSDNKKALASLVSGAVVFVFNIIHSIFATIFRILLAIA